jgi:hypothetical protein
MRKEFWLRNHFESSHFESQEGDVRITRGVILRMKVMEQSGMHLVAERSGHKS